MSQALKRSILSLRSVASTSLRAESGAFASNVRSMSSTASPIAEKVKNFNEKLMGAGRWVLVDYLGSMWNIASPNVMKGSKALLVPLIALPLMSNGLIYFDHVEFLIGMYSLSIIPLLTCVFGDYIGKAYGAMQADDYVRWARYMQKHAAYISVAQRHHLKLADKAFFKQHQLWWQASTLAQWQKLGAEQVKNRALTQLARQTDRVAALARAPAPGAAKLAAVAAPGVAMALVRAGYDFRLPAAK